MEIRYDVSDWKNHYEQSAARPTTFITLRKSGNESCTPKKLRLTGASISVMPTLTTGVCAR